MSLCTIIGLAGIAYLLNDLGDRAKDALAQKPNVLIAMNTTMISTLLVFFTIIALGPWLWFPVDLTSIGFLAAEIILYIIYAIPPFRLKEKGLAGVAVDALYAHLIPALLAAHTYMLIVGLKWIDAWPFLVILSIWQTILGIRNILFHQLQDYTSDKQSGVETFTIHSGVDRVEKSLSKWIIPMEVLAFVGLLVTLSYAITWVIPMAFIFLVWAYKTHPQNSEHKRYRLLAYHYIDNFYTRWLPLAVLIGLYESPQLFIPLLVLHIVLFPNVIKDWFTNFLPKPKTQ